MSLIDEVYRLSRRVAELEARMANEVTRLAPGLGASGASVVKGVIQADLRRSSEINLKPENGPMIKATEPGHMRTQDTFLAGASAFAVKVDGKYWFFTLDCTKLQTT